MSEIKVNKISPRFLVVQQLITKERRQTLVQQVRLLGQQQLRQIQIQVLQQSLVKDIF
jgi:hypothetical protein